MLESTIPVVDGEREDSDNEYAAEGKLLHACMKDYAFQLQQKLTPTQLEILDKARAMEAELLREVVKRAYKANNPDDLFLPATEIREQPVFFREPMGDVTGKLIMRGTPDKVVIYPVSIWVNESAILVCIDYKFGRKEVQPVSINSQLRSYLAMGAELFPAKAYYGAIIQPWLANKATVVEYTPEDIPKARSEILGIWKRAHEENAPRVASGEACEHCKGKALCQSYASYYGEVQKLSALPARQWTAEQWHTFLSRRGEVKKFIKEREEDAKKILALEPDAIPGWGLEEGDKRREVTDIVKAWELLQEFMTPKEFSDCAKLSLGDVEKALWAKVYNSPQRITQKDAKKQVNELLAAVIEIRQNEPSLVERKD